VQIGLVSEFGRRMAKLEQILPKGGIEQLRSTLVVQDRIEVETVWNAKLKTLLKNLSVPTEAQTLHDV
jgi:hypothetical protein